ncbi:MAG: hypothetical protein ACP6IY_11045 [Promethearchaeia archaeon]
MNKKERLIIEVNNIINSYTQKLTLRQIYYRLVAKLIIQNKQSQYKYLSSVLVEARKSGKIPYNAIEDRTREVINNSIINYTYWKKDLEDLLYFIENYTYDIPDNLYQDKITLIVLEKQALEGVFRHSIKGYSNVILIVCRGYNSLTQIWDLSEILKNEDRQVHCRFFSDFDPSGMDIQRNFIEQCKSLDIKFDSFKRIALKKSQVKKYKLPYAPTKLSDSRAKNWHYPGVVELDALDPNILDQMIKKVCKENWDYEVENAKKHFENVMNRIFRKRFSKQLLKLAKKIEKEGI